MNLELCTLTGVDEKSSIERLKFLSTKYDFVEWGFLYSTKQQGQPGRYMSPGSIIWRLDRLPMYVKTALHVCGKGLVDLMTGEPMVRLLAKKVAERGGRIQLNFNAQRCGFGADDITKLMKMLAPAPVIIQHNQANAHLWEQLQLENARFLFDSSGGSGKECKS